MADRPTDPASEPDFAHANGWDAEYETYSDYDLPTYVGPTTFMNLPWVDDPAELRRRKVDVAIVGAPFDDARESSVGDSLRPARHPRGAVHVRLDLFAPARHRAVRCPDRGRRRRCQHRAGSDRTGPRDDLPQGPRGRPDRGDPDHPRWRPFDHLAGRYRHRGGPPAREHRDRPFRRSRRHGCRLVRAAGQPWHADASVDRIRRGQGQELRPGRAARLLAARRTRSRG